MSIVLQQLTTIFALLFLAFQPPRVTAGLLTLYRTHDFPGKQVVFNHESLQDTNYVYAVCDKPVMNRTSQDCIVTYERNSLEAPSVSTSCAVRLVADHGYIIQQEHRVLAFGSERRAILVWYEGKRNDDEVLAHFSVVHLDACNSGEARVALSVPDVESLKCVIRLSLLTTVVTYAESFDVVFHHSKRICAHKICRATFDEYGNELRNPDDFYSNDRVMFIEPVRTNSSGTRYTLFEFSDDEMYLAQKLLGYNGTRTLQVHKTAEFLQRSLARATNGELLTVCAVAKGFASCTQHDLRGALVLNATLDLGESRTRSLAVLNLRGGGFLYMHRVSNRYRVIKVDRSGAQVGAGLEVRGLGCVRIQFPRLFRRGEPGEYCLTLACYEDGDEEERDGHFDVTTKCFEDEAFSRGN